MKRRLRISCTWCKDESRAASFEDLRRVYGRHLRNCNALNRMFVAGRYATGAPFTKEQVIDGILQRSGLHPEGQKLKAERELAALRQQISADPELTLEERAELLAEVDRSIGTVPHEATGRAVAPVPDAVDVKVEPDPIAALVLELAKGAANTDLATLFPSRPVVRTIPGKVAQLEVLAAHEFITSGTARLNEILGTSPADLKQVVFDEEPAP